MQLRNILVIPAIEDQAIPNVIKGELIDQDPDRSEKVQEVFIILIIQVIQSADRCLWNQQNMQRVARFWMVEGEGVVRLKQSLYR
jgi:hypothetical protein